ncbi:MAG: glucoamylase family protein [Steroidobacterales bacterium]
MPADTDFLAALPDGELLEAVQRQSFGFFWDAAHPHSGLAPDRCTRQAGPVDDLVVIAGSGFGVMALIVAVERGWVSRDSALERLGGMLGLLGRATRYHGAFPHFMDGSDGATIPFMHDDDGGDLVETSVLCMGLLCARQYFDRDSAPEVRVRGQITALWQSVEWDWYTRDGENVLYWHWSPNHGWAMNRQIRGWNECLITYLLAASAPRHAVAARVYHEGFATGPGYRNGKTYYGIELPLGMPYGGPLFFCHYSFCGLDPRGLQDRYTSYWEQNVRHARINRAYCIANPHAHRGYGESCWGLTASDEPTGYAAHAPQNDNGTIAPTAALSSMPYVPSEAMQVMRHLLSHHGARVWGRYGFVDAFCQDQDWFADTYLAIDQGPIIIMIENYRSGLLWKLFMSVPEVQAGLGKLGFVRS